MHPESLFAAIGLLRPAAAIRSGRAVDEAAEVRGGESRTIQSVPMQWSVPAHGDALDRLRAALADDGCAGAVVLGPDGVGKSTLARLAADGYAARIPTR